MEVTSDPTEPVIHGAWKSLSEFMREATRKVELLENGGVVISDTALAVCIVQISKAIGNAFTPLPRNDK